MENADSFVEHIVTCEMLAEKRGLHIEYVFAGIAVLKEMSTALEFRASRRVGESSSICGYSIKLTEDPYFFHVSFGFGAERVKSGIFDNRKG